MFFDSHAHLDGPEILPELDLVLARAKAAGLTHIVCVGASHGMESNERSLEIAKRHAGLYATVGIHPHDARLVVRLLSEAKL